MEVLILKIIKRAFLCISIIVVLIVPVACGGPKVEKVDASEVKIYADPAAKKIFTGISEENYDMFSEDFDEQMKSALSESKFREIVSQLGKFESMEIIGADRVQGYTRAYYKGKFSKFSKELTFTVVFSPSGNKRISGLFYK
jgi:hypothetical protein